MANRTVSYAISIHGTNPQYLIDNIVRKRIYEIEYWKRSCTLLNSAKVLERAVDDLKYIGGTYGGNTKPTQFLCLVLKMLQIQPAKEIVYLFIDQLDFKYLRALGAYYLRLVGSPVEIYNKLEPILQDYRKLRVVDRAHKFSVMHMDEFIDHLLREERFFDVILPRMTKRSILEANRDLEPFISKLEDLDLIPAQASVANETNLKSSNDYDAVVTKKLKISEYEPDNQKPYPPRLQDRDMSGRYRYDEDKSHARSSNQPTTSGRKYSRWEQEEINEFNSIRAKLGLKPLRT